VNLKTIHFRNEVTVIRQWGIGPSRNQTAQCRHSSESGHNKLQRGHCDWVLLDNCNSRMPQCCCVRICENKKGGHLFTKNEAMKQKWHLVLQQP